MKQLSVWSSANDDEDVDNFLFIPTPRSMKIGEIISLLGVSKTQNLFLYIQPGFIRVNNFLFLFLKSKVPIIAKSYKNLRYRHWR